MTRLTVQFDDRTTQMINDLSAQRSAAGEKVTQTEILERALAFYDYAHKQADPSGDFRVTVIADGQQKVVEL